MKQWIIITLMLVMIANVNAGFFIDTEGASLQTQGGLFTIIHSYFLNGCVENWVLSYSACLINNTNLKIYTDLNSCGTTTTLPVDNGSFYSYCNYCSINLQINYTSECVYNDTKQDYEINATVFDLAWGSCCNITGLSSDCYKDDTSASQFTYQETLSCGEKIKMETVAIALLLVGFMFWLVYTATTLKTKTESGDTIPLNTFITMIMYAGAGFTAYIAIQIAFGISLAESLSSMIQNSLRTQYTLLIYGGILLLFLLFFGTFGNVLMKILHWFKEKYNPRKENNQR